jgi:DNA integrity scanning protein DisA with diadenylate cyclase activity
MPATANTSEEEGAIRVYKDVQELVSQFSTSPISMLL